MGRAGENHILITYFLRRIVFLCTVAVLAALSSTHAADAERAKRVLMISTGSRLSPGFGLVERKIFDTLQQLGSRRIEFYSEYLDIIRFPRESYQRLFRDYLHEKYAAQTPDLLILNFVGNLVVAEKFLRQLFPGVRVVLAGLTEEDVSPERVRQRYQRHRAAHRSARDNGIDPSSTARNTPRCRDQRNSGDRCRVLALRLESG